MNNCPKCKKNKSQLPPAVLEVINNEPPVLFHKVIYPASLGDDTTNPPDTLNYKNVLLNYEANNHSYLYSSDGVPTFISMGELDIDKIIALLKEQGMQITELESSLANETSNREQADDLLREEINDEASVRSAEDTKLQTQITGNQDAILELQADLGAEASERAQADQTLQDNIDAINSNLNQEVEQSTEFTTDASTVTVNHTKVNLSTNTTLSTTDPLPVASETQAGVMNTSTYTAVQENSENVDSIMNGAVALNGLPASPTQDELTAQWKTATGKTELVNRASIFDETNNKLWYYYTNTGLWYGVGAEGGAVSVSQFTNTAAGIIKGSEEDGQLFAEADGTGSVVGWDAVKHDIDNLSQLVAGIDVPTILTTYKDSPISGDVYSAGYINGKLNGEEVKLGEEITNLSGSTAHNVLVGAQAYIGNRNYGSIAVGHQAYVATFTATNSGIAIGYSANVDLPDGIALGENSVTGRRHELSLGSASGNLTRYIANVKAGELDTDAVNLKQMNDAISTVVGDINTALETLDTGTGVE